MGNSSSRHQQHCYAPHPPVSWTQSFPRDHRRLHKNHKVLPPPPSSTRLRPTENGRSLQLAGTITGRRGAGGELGPQSLPGYASPCLAHPLGPPTHLPHLSTSLTHLHHLPPPCALHNPNVGATPNSSLRFGHPPSKVYTSEPDLRSNGAPSLPPPQSSPHTIISQSPTKGKIRSKKRNRAPPPPTNGALSDGAVGDGGGERGVHWGATDTAPSSRPTSQASKGGRKLGGGLFRKKNESRKSDNESSLADESHNNGGYPLYRRRDHSPSYRKESRDERRERARSVDCLQHELRNQFDHKVRRSTRDDSSDDSPQIFSDEEALRRSRTIERETRRRGAKDERDGVKRDTSQQRMTSTMERRSPVKQYLNSPLKASQEERRKASLGRVFDEWEEAEKVMMEKKKKAEEMRNEIHNAAKNLRKTGRSESVDKDPETDKVQVTEKELVPKSSFFFGMEPPKEKSEEVRIEGNVVEYNSNILEFKISSNVSKSPIRKLSDEVTEFAVAVEKRKHLQHKNYEEELFSSSLRREDGGYHSRQNSGSFPSSDNGSSPTEVTANIRPVLPKRQREIPRFSPNAAWKFLGEEPFLSEENLNESRSSDDCVYEDKIRHFAHPVAPPRRPGEKSADSGISGDAGSPGPMPEFEPIKIVRSGDANSSGSHWRGGGGPLAVSSPVVNSETRRAWTPAQDLDDNSLDDSGGNSEPISIPGLTAPPKLNTRASMFDVFSNQDVTNNNNVSSALPKLTSKTNMFGALNGSQTDVRLSNSYHNDESSTAEESTQTITTNFRKLKRSVSNGYNNINGNVTALNEYNKSVQNDKWRDNWTMARSIPGSLNGDRVEEPGPHVIPVEAVERPVHPVYRRGASEGARSNSSYPIQGGHVMYLPEYNISSPVRSSSRGDMEDQAMTQSLNRSQDSSCSSPAINISSRELNSSRHLNRDEVVMAPAVPRWVRKGGKKFSYQSTVRIMEKKRLEEHLNREVQEKERQRLREAAAMKRVEEEFQMKRELEKKRLKQQLKLYQVMEKSDNKDLEREQDDSVDDVTGKWQDERGSESPQSSISARQKSTSRQAPDGAPASIAPPRQEAIVAARQRNGLLVTQELGELQQPRREYREYRSSNRPVQPGVGDNYRRDFSKGNTQSTADECRYSSEPPMDSVSTCSSSSRGVKGVKGRRYFEHPPVLGNLAPVGGKGVYQLEAYNRHISNTKLVEI